MEAPKDDEKYKSFQILKFKLQEIEKKLILLTKTFDWDFNKLLEEGSNMVTCSINNQHTVPQRKIKFHKESCCLRSEGYNELDKIFPDYSGAGSCISLTSQLMDSITKNIPSAIENKTLRSVPQTSANFDQNFSREEKLAIYDYVIANTKKQNTFSDLCGHVSAKKVEKKEMTVWEIAAAERDAKRRRASYRNKVHTNCKTHTQILREVIEGQMEMLREESMSEKFSEESKRCVMKEEKPNLETHCQEDKKKFLKIHSSSKEEGDTKRKHNNHYRSKRSRRDSRGDSGSRSRSRDRYRKWKTSERRSHFHKSSG